MEQYFHSVRLDVEKCKGCTNCIKRCPTEAIRVREGKARILEERCIDCGECIRICPNHAKVAVTDSLEDLRRFKHTVALPAPAFFGQFGRTVLPEQVSRALVELGFDSVWEVAVGAEAATVAIRRFLATRKFTRPLISSACPAIVRLMQRRFASLLDHIIPVETPMDIAAKMAKERKSRELGIDPSEVGTFFITPCPAKVTAVKQPVGTGISYVDGAIAMSTVYPEVLKRLDRQVDPAGYRVATGVGLGWARSGGENAAIAEGALLAVDGIHNAVVLLDGVEKGELGDIDYLECQACVGGCIGGPLVIQNPFVARARIRNLVEKLKQPRLGVDEDLVAGLFAAGYFDLQARIEPRPVMKLDEDVAKAIDKLRELEKTVENLPGLDCGSCGAPSCRALAEDIVRGLGHETDCVFKLRERVQVLAEEMVELAQKVPSSMRKEPEPKREGEPA